MGSGENQGWAARSRGVTETGADRKGAQIEGESALAQRPQRGTHETAEEQEEGGSQNEIEEGRQEEKIIESEVSEILLGENSPSCPTESLSIHFLRLHPLIVDYFRLITR